MKVKSESEVAQSCPTQQPHGLQPTRLLRPWDFPGKSTGVGRHCLLRLLRLNSNNGEQSEHCFAHSRYSNILIVMLQLLMIMKRPKGRKKEKRGGNGDKALVVVVLLTAVAIVDNNNGEMRYTSKH